MSGHDPEAALPEDGTVQSTAAVEEAEVTRLLQTFRKTQLTKLVGGIFLIVWSGICFLVFVLAFMTLTEDATWVSIIALMAGVLMCAIAPIVFLMMVCCETSARGKIDQLCSDLAKERSGLSIRVDERAWNPGRKDIGIKKSIIFSQRSSQVGSDQAEADAQAEPELEALSCVVVAAAAATARGGGAGPDDVRGIRGPGGGSSIRITPAPQPTDIIWENQDIAWYSRLWRQALVLLLFVIILSISLCLIYVTTVAGKATAKSQVSYLGVPECDPAGDQVDLQGNEQYKCLITAAANWTKQYATEEGGDILSCWCTAQGYEALFQDQALLDACTPWLWELATSVGIAFASSTVSGPKQQVPRSIGQID
eukprot:s2197_g2.t1